MDHLCIGGLFFHQFSPLDWSLVHMATSGFDGSGIISNVYLNP